MAMNAINDEAPRILMLT